MNKHSRLIVLLLLALPFGSAWSATVTLVPEAAAVAPGEIQVDLVLDAADVAAGCTPRCSEFAGEVLISYDETQLRLVGLEFVPPATEAPGDLGPGPVFIVPGDGSPPQGIGFVDALEVGTVATLTFDVIAAPGETVSIGVEDAQPILGSFEYAEPTNQFFFPEFVGAEIQVVPVPAAAWLFLSALGVIAARARRAR